jgi:photosystem II stability/assembly factor-like uncharacterized protein
MATSRGVGVLAAAAVVGIAGCGTVREPAAAGSAGPGASTTDRSASSSSAPASASAGPTGGHAAGPVPGGFAATSVTWVSPNQAFVLGTAPCAHAPCTSIVRTVDRGVSWVGLPAPAEPVGEPTLGGAPVVWGIRFATPEHGFVFGDGLWETTDGGQRWTRAVTPPGSVLSLAIVQGQVFAIIDRCTPEGGCAQPGTLARRKLSGGPWVFVASGAAVSLSDPDDLIATQAGVAAVVADHDVLVTADGGRTLSRNPIPCPAAAPPPSVAVTSATGLAMLCTGGAYTGHTIKQVYVSDDDGAHWTLAGAPSPDGDGGTIAATITGHLAIATASAASWLFYSADAGASWRIVNQQDDGGMGWADLGFTTAADGVVVHGPADSDGNVTQRPGQLFLTGDAGATWRQVRF